MMRLEGLVPGGQPRGGRLISSCALMGGRAATTLVP